MSTIKNWMMALLGVVVLVGFVGCGQDAGSGPADAPAADETAGGFIQPAAEAAEEAMDEGMEALEEAADETATEAAAEAAEMMEEAAAEAEEAAESAMGEMNITPPGSN